MSFVKTASCVLLLVCFPVSISGSYIDKSTKNPQPPDESYTYAKTLNAFYKVHKFPGTWNMARTICQAEGATLMWFLNEHEAKEILQVFPKSYYEMFLGIHRKFSKHNLVTLAGLQIEHVYNTFNWNELANADDKYECVSMSRAGSMLVTDCDRRLPFICRRDYDANLNYFDNKCKTHDEGYVYEKDTNKCYKIHTVPKNWTDAYTICSAENAYLAVINSVKESQAIARLIKNVHIQGTYWTDKSQFLLGFHDIFSEGEYRTIFGETLKEAGYDKFDSGQPNNVDVQNCGSIMSNGNINDIWCAKPFPFICERDLTVAAVVE